MPSWNIHTAHVERLLADRDGAALGIADANAFLFGNFVPDIYVGFMVLDASFRVDYCITHIAEINSIPVPDAGRFWDDYLYRRRPKSPAAVSLTLGAWAHLIADGVYNARFRAFCRSHVLQHGETLRVRKQADFDLFGSSLGISSLVQVTPELLEASWHFKPYSVASADVERAVAIANAITAQSSAGKRNGSYQLLSDAWLSETFELCNDMLASWLQAWQRLESRGDKASAAAIQAECGLQSALEMAGL